MKDWVPLLQTLSWIGLIVFSVRKFSFQLQGLFEAIKQRVVAGSSFKAGPVEPGEDLKALEKVSQSKVPVVQQEDDWSKERDTIYSSNNGFFLAHVIEPSTKQEQVYDIFIYIVCHKSKALSDIDYGEFFLGSYWGNKVYKETKKNSLIGISTSAYGPFLCTCRVRMKDGREIRLNRYIDFEMGRVFKQNRITSSNLTA